MKRLIASLLAIAAALAAATLASAQTGPTVPTPTLEQRTAIASGMCHQSVQLAAPIGNEDIKDSPKLDAYCSCFTDKFVARGTKIIDGTLPHQTLKESVAGEREMRNACRRDLGLPVLQFK